MRQTLITILTLFVLKVSLIPATAFAADYALIIGGVGGEKSFYDAFWSATSRFHHLLTEAYGYAPEQITFLFEDEGETAGLVNAEAKREPILTAFAQFAEKVQPSDRFILLMLGHATRSPAGLKFNLPGRDISQVEYTQNINSIRAKQQILIFGFPYSEQIVQSLSAPGRIIITSNSVNEGYASRAGFGDILVDALSQASADTNGDGTISLLEAFLWMQERTKEWYEQDGTIQSEHPQLDDNGDGTASSKALVSQGKTQGEGTLAEKNVLRKTSFSFSAKHIAKSQFNRRA